MKQFNEKLANWMSPSPSKEAGINNIQIPGQVEHLVWQTRYKNQRCMSRTLSNI